ncbi:hypothetical protein [Micromonospora sp. NPDC049799]
MDQLTDPLAGLDDLPWESLHHAYGPAVDVPDQLRALRSDLVHGSSPPPH